MLLFGWFVLVIHWFVGSILRYQEKDSGVDTCSHDSLFWSPVSGSLIFRLYPFLFDSTFRTNKRRLKVSGRKVEYLIVERLCGETIICKSGLDV